MPDKTKQDSTDEVMVDNASTENVISTTETVEKEPSGDTKTTTHKHTSKSKKDSKSSKGLITGLVALLLVLVLIIGSVFLRIGNQTVLARTLDALGQHKLALSSDYIGSKGLLSKQAGASTLDPSKPEDCAAIWTQISSSSLNDLQKDLASTDYNKQSSVAKYLIQPVANDYKDKFKFEGFYATSSDIKNSDVAFSTTSSLNIDTDALTKAVPSVSGIAPDLGLVSLSGTGKFVLQSKKMFVSLPDLNLKAKGLDEKGSLSSSYSYDMPANDATSVNPTVDTEKLNKALGRFLSPKLNEALSDDTGKAIFAYFCSGVKSYTVEAPADMSFGLNEYTRRRYVRPTTLELKPDFYSVYLKGLPNLIEKLSQDPKLKPFLKANYDTFKELNQTSTKPSEFPTREEFDKQVDGMFKDFKKDVLSNDIDLAVAAFNKAVKITAAPIKTYIDMETMQEYGGEFELVVAPTAESLASLGSPEIASILKDGILFKTTIYDIKYGAKAEPIQAPTGTKDIQTLPDDFMQTPLGKKLTELAGTTQSQMMQGQDPSMSNGAMTTPIPDGNDIQNRNSTLENPNLGNGAGNVQLNPDGTYTLPDGTTFDPKNPPVAPNGQ